MLSVSKRLNEKLPTLSCGLAVALILAFRFTIFSSFVKPFTSLRASYLYHLHPQAKCVATLTTNRLLACRGGYG